MTLSFEELCEKMEAAGWTRKDFNNAEHYRGWYYRNRKKVERSSSWHINHPFTFWHRPLNSEEKTGVEE